jgi:hypothetical protein
MFNISSREKKNSIVTTVLAFLVVPNLTGTYGFGVYSKLAAVCLFHATAPIVSPHILGIGVCLVGGITRSYSTESLILF